MGLGSLYMLIISLLTYLDFFTLPFLPGIVLTIYGFLFFLTFLFIQWILHLESLEIADAGFIYPMSSIIVGDIIGSKTPYYVVCFSAPGVAVLYTPFNVKHKHVEIEVNELLKHNRVFRDNRERAFKRIPYPQLNDLHKK